MYKILPETDNVSLEDIELHFSDNSRSLTDRKVIQSNTLSKANHDTENGMEKSTVINRFNTGTNGNKSDKKVSADEMGCDNKGFSMDL